jgi:homopolymeric O-antigen transport system permease protein
MAYYRFMPDWRALLLPVFSLWAIAASLGPGLYLTALNVKFRDFRYIIPFIVQFGLYVSPVGFPSGRIADRWGDQARLLFSLNPIVGVIDGFRWCLLAGESQLFVPGLLTSLGVTVLFLWLGVKKFRATERSIADII